MRPDQARTLEASDIDAFVRDGFVKIQAAFSPELAERCRAILWQDLDCSADDPTTWTQPVVWLWDYAQPPFVEAANTPVLHRAFDSLVGQGRWRPRTSIGTFPVRFPSTEDTGDTGWHIDASLPPLDDNPEDQADFSKWRVNIQSDGRALLMLFLFSDVGETDAPTRIRVGSHRPIARYLAPLGDDGAAQIDVSLSDGCPETLATGNAGDVYLCHPFLVHAAQINRGAAPRFMAQPPLFQQEPNRLDRTDGDYSPVERAILKAIGDEA
ncbi:phytanoyl-CoA dioxygenase family protein [Brevundimonas sp. PAMC22021]|uniref:phytanoyl-CoA dioxygenase family protein n=1 Tax=Brevundimonas sp. PAMC22021 TaxID=2861285 RepID=UPI001C63B100|nr:phytanoyl-CoA dioxygenase family protein [Brevundimonas sp. PAMC22021]QYF86677.1 phytanoyl-CoA dioxygenase family protein [Brevundimonas sp. PAMC22021]